MFGSIGWCKYRKNQPDFCIFAIRFSLNPIDRIRPKPVYLLMKKYFLLLTLIIFQLSVCTANTRKQRVYESFILGNMTQWIQVVDEMERTPGVKTLAWKLELAEYYYGLIPYYLSKNKDRPAAATLTKTETLLRGILKEHPDNADALAFMGSTAAFKIALDKYKVVVLGKESLQWLKKSLEVDSDNIRALTDQGHALFHAPKVFGGNPEEGLKNYNKAILLYEKKELTKENWLYLNTLVTTAKAYIDLGQSEKAVPLCEKAMKTEPRFRQAWNLLASIEDL
jgi:tetratricopeptide (TPR) repeat protein